MKTKEELNAIKGEVEELNKKLAELTEEELAQVTGGLDTHFTYFLKDDDDPAACSAAKKNPLNCLKLRSGLQ